MPSDAEINDDTNWISNEYITRKIKSYSARNILVIADSCYSGTLTREAPNFEVSPDFKAMQSFLTTKTRLVLSSEATLLYLITVEMVIRFLLIFSIKV